MRKLLLALLLAARGAHATSTCPMMTPYNVFIAYTGSVSNCVVNSPLPCTLGEAIQFSVAGFGYDFSCSTHTFQWNFGDGIISNARSPTHVYVSSGVYLMTVTITSAQQRLLLTQNIVVTPIGDLPSPFSRHELFDERGRIQRGYIFTIEGAAGAGDWIWNFGDGTAVRGPQRVQNHIYKSGGTFTVTLSSASSTNIYSMQFEVPIDRRRSARH